MINTRQARVADVEVLAPMFDAYRIFYGNASDLELAKKFLLERFSHNESIIFIAENDGGDAVGFTQLYPSFSSGAAARIFILNDLFVVPQARRIGVARLLMDAAASYGRAVGAVRLKLSTAIDNKTAQALYESQGWVRDTHFYNYDISL